MEILQAFLVALVAALIYMESRIGGQHMLDRPIIIGPVVGLIMGDVPTGLFVGGNLELVWMGLVGIGTSTPPDVVVGSALATALAIQTGADYATTLALAIPVSLLAQVGSIGVCICNTFFAHRADACAEKEDYRGVEISHWMGSVLYFVFKFAMIFIGCLIGGDVITAIVENIPAVIQNGLSQSSNLLPALGVGMLIQMTFDKKFGAFLFLGFVLAAFLGMSTVGAAFVGFVCAWVYYMFVGNKQVVAIADDESEEL
ncbi:PTS mannose/fructose/sorbose/N-acetylgalactosamine transporter subunit IIC [Traorella massiliensis]|uniref:PTS mannose/fructose/sorbose/N-acetylgalactosamine transporter subunit IIC n=1 Tax=Traorella massiliensis TaxID=1903263 RepID=UPI002356817D|nr:PTS sugar transporter subunit IIC [Traorella massiliensis]